MRTVIKVLLTLLLLTGCASIALVSDPVYTLRHPDMNYTEFIERADTLVKESFPEWYVEGVGRHLASEQIGSLFASVDLQEDGTLLITLYEKSWDLCTVEDLASVLLHEYVHAKIWFRLAEEIEDEWCRSAMHELTAYNAELTQTKINVTPAMRSSTEFGYRFAYVKAMSDCSREDYDSFPSPGATYNR